ncbi:MAG: PHP domain-containing protein, partial [Planktomarina temperata]|nr:PHP domain-containing protein [Planktomarina temperata]
MRENPKFIHLRVHSEYSLLEGAVRLKKLPDLAVSMGMPAIAVTDTNNMFCALEFSEAASKAGIQPIIGCQVDMAYDSAPATEKPRAPAALVLLAQNERGYENLMALNSCLYLDSDGTLPQVQMAQLAAHAEGVICLTGGPNGPLGKLLQNGQTAKAQALLEGLAQAFGDRLYVELQRHPSEDGRMPDAERLSERGLVEMAYAMDLPLVATNDVYFPKPEIYEAHDALICIAEGSYVDQQGPRRRLTPQ